MKHCPALLAVLIASLVFAAPASGQSDYSYARVVRLSFVEGDVQYARPDADGWERASVNLPIQQGFSLATGQGRSEIEFESGATARLAEDSILQFTELALSGGARLTKLTLTQGTATFYANPSREDSFVVATPHVQAVLSDKGSFRMDVFEDATSVSVLQGSLQVDSSAGTHHLTKGRTLSYRAGEPDQVALGRNPKGDEWDRWVADREEVVNTASSASLNYVRSPYSYGLADLYSYGHWFLVPGYGRCWRPYGIGFHWVPYWDGRWVFYPRLGWTWVSYEPWGWLPYHFGRWVYTPTFGWCWLPGYFNTWQPALVTWVRIGNQVGWVPRSPQDQPGRTPVNLQHGVVVNTRTSSGDRPPVRRLPLGARERPELLERLPAGFALTPTTQTVRSSAPPTRTPSSIDRGEIVFDPRERKFVNNPAGRPVRIGDAHQRSGDAPVPRATSVAPVPRPAPTSAAAPQTGISPTPQRPASQVTPRQAPQRVDAPRPAPARVERPATRTESSRPAPAPRMESAPRAAPPTSRMESAPRPGAAPPAVPRGERPAQPQRPSPK